MRGSALTAHEYVMTLDQEVAAVWRRKWTASSLLLLSVRWVMVFVQVALCIPASSKVRVMVLDRFKRNNTLTIAQRFVLPFKPGRY